MKVNCPGTVLRTAIATQAPKVFDGKYSNLQLIGGRFRAIIGSVVYWCWRNSPDVDGVGLLDDAFDIMHCSLCIIRNPDRLIWVERLEGVDEFGDGRAIEVQCLDRVHCVVSQLFDGTGFGDQKFCIIPAFG